MTTQIYSLIIDKGLKLLIYEGPKLSNVISLNKDIKNYNAIVNIYPLLDNIVIDLANNKSLMNIAHYEHVLPISFNGKYINNDTYLTYYLVFKLQYMKLTILIYQILLYLINQYLQLHMIRYLMKILIL